MWRQFTVMWPTEELVIYPNSIAKLIALFYLSQVSFLVFLVRLLRHDMVVHFLKYCLIRRVRLAFSSILALRFIRIEDLQSTGQCRHTCAD